MKQRGSTVLLRIAVFCIGIPVLALCIFLLPKIAGEAIEQFQLGGTTLASIVLGLVLILYVSAVPFYMALYQALKLLRYIDYNEAFSELSVVALKKIRNYGLTISGLYTIALPLLYVIAEWDDAPALILIGLVIAVASFVVAVFAALLKRLLQEAIDIKKENDLTV